MEKALFTRNLLNVADHGDLLDAILMYYTLKGLFEEFLFLMQTLISRNWLQANKLEAEGMLNYQKFAKRIIMTN